MSARNSTAATRNTKRQYSKPISEDLAQRLYCALEKRYPGKVWRTIEVCPIAVVKTIDNEADALETIRRLEQADRDVVTEKCFACGKPLDQNRLKADTRDSQIVFVGPDCHRRIVTAGEIGYQPPKGGPRLYPMKAAK